MLGLQKYSRGLVLLALVTACGRGPMIGNPVPEAGQPSSPTLPTSKPTPGQWTLIPRDEVHHYRTTTTSIIDLAGVEDTIKTNSVFSLGLQNRAGKLGITATFDTIAIQSSSKIESSPRTPALPFQISGHLENSTLQIDDASPTNCDNQSVLIPVLEHVISKPPVDLENGMTWTDTLSIAGCSGGIPVTLTSIRTYQVMGERSTGSLQGIEIARTDKTVSTGQGEEGQHRVGISSASSGTARLLIDRQSGSLLLSTGQYSGAVTVITSGRRQVFNQTVREVVERM